jgi:hypothetical protein
LSAHLPADAHAILIVLAAELQAMQTLITSIASTSSSPLQFVNAHTGFPIDGLDRFAGRRPQFCARSLAAKIRTNWSS